MPTLTHYPTLRVPSYPEDWLQRPFLALDLETSGVDPETDRIVTWAAAFVEPDGRATYTDGVVRPDGFEIPDGAAAVHGWTTEMARDSVLAVDLPEALERITEIINAGEAKGCPIVIYNAPFDATMILRELDRVGMPYPRALFAGPILDPLVLDHYVARFRKGRRTLGAVCEHYGVTLEDAHDAGADAIAAAQLARTLIGGNLNLAALPLSGVHHLQSGAHSEQKERLEAYLRRSKNDPAITISRDWPYRSVRVAEAQA